MIIKTIHDNSTVSDYLSTVLTTELQEGKKVLWLIPGGSAIAVATAVSHRIPSELKKNLTISLTDERYGDIHHADSNWVQLTDAGFDFSGATLKPVLTGVDRAQATEQFSSNLKEILQSYDYTLGFFGIGPDGHTAGILPNSPALKSQHYAADYDANFERITMTSKAIMELNEAVAFAVGENKWPIIKQLQSDIPIDDQPAQILKSVPKFTIFTDYEGDK